MALEDLSSLLWREHELLDLLLFKAEEKQYVIVSNKTRWLPRIAKEIEVILDQLRSLEIDRAAETEGLAAQYSLSTGPSLSELADKVGEPWRELLLRHHQNLLTIVTEIRALSDFNRGLVESGLSALDQSLLLGSAPTPGLYTAAGRQDDITHRAVTLDGAL
ncbi:MAG: flagellar protein FlgN [Propionicimonas sp.]